MTMAPARRLPLSRFASTLFRRARGTHASAASCPKWAIAARALIATLTAAPSGAFGATAAQVSVGDNFVCAVDTMGGLSCWGNNTSGELGDGTTMDRTTPVAVVGLGSGVQAVSAGNQHACALTTGGGVKCWGDNADGQLGDGTTGDSHVPVDVVGLGSGVAAVSAASNHSCALTTGGGVKCWGRNHRGQLGDATNTDSPVPVDVSGLGSGVAAIEAGGIFGHTCALTSSGGAKCWGANLFGQLGDGTNDDSSVPVDVSGLSSGVAALATNPVYSLVCALTTAGGVKCWGSASGGSTPADIPGLTSGVVAIDVATEVLALIGGGAVKEFDPNPAVTGLFDVPGLQSGIAAVSLTDVNSCVLTTAGEIKCWGFNSDGQLGEGNTAFAATAGCVAGFGDSDFDRICDSADPCTGGETFAAMPKPRMVLSKIHADPTPGNDRLQLRTRVPLPAGVSFADLDFIGGGARLTIVDPGGIEIDRTFAAGTYGGRGTAGWFTNSLGKMWTFLDGTGPNNAVIARLVVIDKGGGLPGGLVDVSLLRKNETLPIVPANLPLQAIFVFGDAAAGSSGVCGQSAYAQLLCAFNGPQTSVVCRQHPNF
jgi:hypothetical protein